MRHVALLRGVSIAVSACLCALSGVSSVRAQEEPIESIEEPEASEQTEARCRPECRAGFLCIDGACVSACNPPCGEGEVCTEEATCEPVRGEEEEEEAVFVQPTPVRAPKRGTSFSAGLGFDYSRPFHLATTSGGEEYAAHAGAPSIQGIFAAGFGVVGARLSGGVIRGSDSSSLNAFFSLGPTFTKRLGSSAYIGFDLSVDVFGYDLEGASFIGADSFDWRSDPSDNDVEADFLASLGAAIRVGGIIPVTDSFAVVPELRIHSTFLNLVTEETVVQHPTFDGCCDVDQATAVYVPGVTLSISAMSLY